MKTKKLAKVAKQEPGDFYYQHLKLPYRNYDASRPGDFPFHPDPEIEDVIDISTDQGDQLGFVIVKRDKTVEIVRHGDRRAHRNHVRLRFGSGSLARLSFQTNFVRSALP